MQSALDVPSSTPDPRPSNRDPARELENLWQQGQRPDVREFLQGLAQPESITPAQVVGALCVDQWQRWQQGERVPAEVYLQMHPGLAEAPDDAFDLVYGEFLLREELGEQPTTEDFLKRFPQYHLQFQRQAAVHRAIESGKAPEPTILHGPQSILGEQTAEFEVKPALEPEWPTIPGYTILSKLGQGGMGQVFKALQTRLDRVVALKVIRQECLLQEPKAAIRFQREAQAAANLNHPNIIVVYDFDQIDKTYYIAMEYVEGIDLDQMVRESGPLPVEKACDFIRQAALGLQHAHEVGGMVHRDIKPSNLLIALGKKEVGAPDDHPLPAGELPSRSQAPPGDRGAAGSNRRRPAGPSPDGILKILDMGMALLLHSADSDGSQTMQGTLMGTPDYIAPEQAMDSHQVDIRADLYSLGCTFYYLLCGRPPYAEYPLLKKLMMHQAGQSRPVRLLQPDVPIEVEEIVAKLMSRWPQDRFQTPAELVEALENFAQKKTALTGLAASLDLDIQAILKNRDALSHSSEKPASPSQGGSSLEWTGAKALVRREGPEFASKVATLKQHKGWVMTVAFSPNRRVLAAGPVHGNVTLWALPGSRPSVRAILETSQAEVHSLAFSPNNEILAAGSGRLDGQIWLWSLATPAPTPVAILTGHTSPVEALEFSADGTMLVSGSCDRTVRTWDLTGPEIKERSMFQGHLDHVKAVAFAPDGKTVLSAGLDGTVRMWRKTGGLWSRDAQDILQGRWGPIHTMALSPDGKMVAFGGLDQIVRLYSLPSATRRSRSSAWGRIAAFQGHLGVIRQVRFSPDGSCLASVCDRGRVVFWDLATKAKSREWQLPAAGVYSVNITLDTRYLAAGTSDGTVDLFRLYAKKKKDSE
jgi:serine/threonine-protein kinase